MLSTPEYSLVRSVISLRALVGSLVLPKMVVRFIAENLALDQFWRTRRVIYTVLGIGVLPRELLPLIVPEGPLEPVIKPRLGGTSPVFQRLASRSSTEDIGQEVRRGETLG
jgi:hypothetical protein